MREGGLRIIQLIDTLDTGGAERMALNMANAFAAQNIPNLLIVSRRKGSLHSLLHQEDTLRVLGKNSTLDIKAFKKLLAEVDEFQPDLIHAHGTSVYWGIGLKLLRPAIKLIWHDHLGISEEVIQNNPRRELLWIGKRLDFVFTADESTQTYWQQKKLLAKDRIAYLPNFPSLSPSVKKQTEKFTFLHLANYRSEKGQLNLIHAAKILRDQGLEFVVRMVGKEVDSSWKKEVLKQRADFGLEDSVLVEDTVHDVSGLLSEVNAGLVASDREGLPVSLLEYGLADLPVISTKVGQCSEVLGNGKFGRIVAVGRPDLLAEQMEAFIRNPSEALALGKSFGKQVAENYGEAQFKKTYFSVVERILTLKQKTS
ncbi:glycosyltransferase family 4 protein [Algoriphagus litoralis]|uniref:glycosyltransferase family 4 protein n=1 Tax=Algoriphagus litoralis TaxID=2202829 RepID=UPI000DBA66D2|nr:glycosyltransferase family 4 protein [Algoriphagus litoralis]